jgi:CheY-like chemotaxis protein
MLDIDFSPVQAPILVASGSVADADLVASILADEFHNVVPSVRPEDAASDFDRQRPAVLILAFETLEAAERYHANLRQICTATQNVPYRTLILCNKHELWTTYQLCREERFDDYVLFWPITNDAPRLKMAVHHAMRRLKEKALAPVTVSELATQVRSLAPLERELLGSITQIARDLDIVGLTVSQAEQAMDSALDPARTESTTAAANTVLQPLRPSAIRDLERVIRSMSTAFIGLQQRATEMERRLPAQLEPVRKALKLSLEVRSAVLVVEDDEFQQKLITKLLAGQNFTVLFASTAAEAMALMWQHRPDVVLMDVGLPDISGVELTGRIRNIANFSSVRIIMITGHSERHIVVDSLRAGATDFLVKPVDRAKLIDKLRDFLPQKTPE